MVHRGRLVDMLVLGTAKFWFCICEAQNKKQANDKKWMQIRLM